MATEQAADVWGLTVGHWHAVTGIGTVSLTVATGVLAWVAWYQIGAAREETKKTRTLDMIGKYDHDPVLDRALRRTARARDSKLLFTNTNDYRIDIVAIMNYFETIAIGIRQGMYIEAMVRDFMEPIVRSHIQEIDKHKLFEKIDADPSDFEHICALNNSWMPKPSMHFKGEKQ